MKVSVLFEKDVLTILAPNLKKTKYLIRFGKQPIKVIFVLNTKVDSESQRIIKCFEDLIPKIYFHSEELGFTDLKFDIIVESSCLNHPKLYFNSQDTRKR